jgi:hypothetical protein
MIGLARLKTMCNDRRGVLSLGNGGPTRRHRVTMRNGFPAATCLGNKSVQGAPPMRQNTAGHGWFQVVAASRESVRGWRKIERQRAKG